MFPYCGNLKTLSQIYCPCKIFKDNSAIHGVSLQMIYVQTSRDVKTKEVLNKNI